VLGADPDDVVFVDNATTGFASVVHSCRWEPGDVLVTTSHAYMAVQNTLRRLTELHGVVVRVADVPFPIRDPAEVVDALDPLLDGARLAVVDHITSVTGLVFPIAEVAERCRRKGVPLFVDAAHALGQVELSVPAIGADWWVSNAHKWLFAPKGCAVMVVRRDRHADTHPAVWSNGTGEGLHMEFDFVGTRDPSPWLAVEAALDAVEAFGGLDRIRAYAQGLRRQASELLRSRMGTPAAAPESMLASLCTMPLPDRAPFRGGWGEAKVLGIRIWEQHRIEAMFVPWQGRLFLRISPQIYNHLDEYEALARVLSGL
jgi:isopenicillin-N epimerase